MKKIKWDLVVTRHPALIKLLRERGIITDDITVLTHATEDDIKDKNVLGVLPLSLACKAMFVGEIQLNIPQEMRGKELDIETLREIAGELKVYTVFSFTTKS